MTKYNSVDKKGILLSIVLLELFLLGSGQFISYSGLSLRMFIFSSFNAFALLLFTAGVSYQKKIGWFVLGYTVHLSFYTSLGIINGANIGFVLTDLKPLIFAYMVIPFSLLIIDMEKILLVRKLILFSGILMSLLFLALLISLLLGILDFNIMYIILSSPANDFMINYGDIPRIFYKGMLYIGIASLFLYYGKYNFRRILFFILVVSLVLTFTRGFIVALFLTITFMMFLEINKQNNVLKLILLFVFLVVATPLYLNFIGDKSISDADRYLQIAQVLDAVNPVSFFIGHGFGIGVPIRQVHMEIAFLEIFHKQGIIGLSLWLGFISYLTFVYLKFKTFKDLARPFIASVFFVFFQSLTNPFINNPIGMSMVLITFVVFIVLQKYEREEKLCY